MRAGLVVRRRAEHEIAGDDVEQRRVGTAGDREGCRIGAAGVVGVRRGERRDHGGILGDRLGRCRRDDRSGVIGGGQIHRQRLDRGVGAVKGRNLHDIAVRVGGVVRRVAEHQVAADHVEQRRIGPAGDRERCGVRADGVGIGRGQCRDQGGVGDDRQRRIGRDDGRVVVQVGHVDRDGLGGGVGAVEGRNLDLIAVRAGVVVRRIAKHQIAADDIEQRRVGSAGDRERRGVGADRIHVGRGQRRDHGGVLGDGLDRIGGDDGGVIVGVGHIDRDGLGRGVDAVEG